MKNSYPIVLMPEKVGFVVFIPDFNVNTQGDDLTEALEMARDAIGLLGIDMEDDNEELPVPSTLADIQSQIPDGGFASYVDVDFTDYRRKYESHTVKKNCTLPGWLNYEAEKANINFSAVLQAALKNELHLTDR